MPTAAQRKASAEKAAEQAAEAKSATIAALEEIEGDDAAAEADYERLEEQPAAPDPEATDAGLQQDAPNADGTNSKADEKPRFAIVTELPARKFKRAALKYSDHVDFAFENAPATVEIFDVQSAASAVTTIRKNYSSVHVALPTYGASGVIENVEHKIQAWSLQDQQGQRHVYIKAVPVQTPDVSDDPADDASDSDD